MSRPVFVIPAESLAGRHSGDRVHLDGPEAQHAVRVRRLRPGAQIDLVDGRGTRAAAQITEVSGEPVQVVTELSGVQYEPAPVPALGMIQALAKGGRDDQAVEMATEVGVQEVTPWQAQHSVSQWRGSKVDGGRRRWQQICTAAAKQARRSHIPQVHPLVAGEQLSDLVRNACGQGQAVLVLHEQATTPIASAQIASATSVHIVVGPEGGLSSQEVGALQAAGAQPVLLGPHVLRTSSAGPIGLALLAHQLGHWAQPR